MDVVIIVCKSHFFFLRFVGNLSGCVSQRNRFLVCFFSGPLSSVTKLGTTYNSLFGFVITIASAGNIVRYSVNDGN